MKNKKTLLRKKADKLWAQKYLKDRCEICGSSFILQGHHFFYRSSYGELRYSKENHITLCRACHFLLHHQDPKKIEEKIVEKRGKKWLKELTKLSKEKKFCYQTIAWYEDNIKRLQEYLEK